MADPITFESIGVSMSTHPEGPRARPQADTPCKILIIGDFSGRANRGVETDGSDIDRRTLYRVDRDNDDSVMEKMGVSLQLQWEEGRMPPVELAFAEMEDFHPEQIFYRTPIFKALKKSRRQLLDPETAAEIIGRLSKEKTPTPETDAPGPSPSPGAAKIDFSVETTGGLLDQVLDASSSDANTPGYTKPQTDWDRFLGAVVGPHLVPDIGDEQDAMVAAVDRSISETMRGILHHPDFQALESAWRALRFCLRRLETDETMRIYLLDATRREVAADLTANEDIRDTALYKKLRSAVLADSQQAPWSFLAGVYTFSREKTDAVTLARLGAMGQILDAPFVGAADAGLVGAPSLADNPDPSDWTLECDPNGEKAWRVLRTLPEAAWVGLAMPRFIIRWPYGEKTDPVDAFDFEEIADPANHEDYLWTNPVFALIQVFGRTFTHHGWDWSRGLVAGIDDLPLIVAADGEEKAVRSCAEVFFSERALEILVANGIMPLVAFKDTGRIGLARLQSIADPPGLLCGPWTR
ncbi:type VI secretion system contractile sheath domain-containing protein [uncultured Desulfosarcina sp.]|uniref:type VI secretion system contractile sheath domain-containing protein n=1 Tax=uncultured Desulfosarcina sp. TaxID=218289 RepID=UPI0029C863FF|nr:type VI secretion system contractile sheath large subunit [uncultured Desulfosarcina sp.]